MTDHKKTIAAVIVTYNRADKLSKVLDAVLAQNVLPDRVYVVDNASTDHTAEIIRAKASGLIEHMVLPTNIGGAGGFHAGIKAAYAGGHDYFWVMDDDGYPAEDALKVLRDSLESFAVRHKHQPSFACSSVRWIDNDLCEMNTPNPVWDWPRFYSPDLPVFLVGSCSFVSVLIPAWAVKIHGLPIKDYFIWYDDAEYTQRIAQSYPGLFCPQSIVIHDTPENKGVNYGFVNQASLWKFRYGARNEASFRYHYRGKVSFLSFLRRIRGEMNAAGVPGHLKREIYKAAFSGIRFNPAIEKV